MLRLSRWLLLGAVIIALSSCSTSEVVQRKNTSRTFNTVVIDAGHGGKDSGAVRRYGPAEKNATLDVAQRLNAKLRQANFRTVMTRSSDVFIPLDERVAIGNQQSNSIFVSIHFNDSGRRGVHGFETYYNSPYAYDLADRIQLKLTGVRHASNRGVRTANFRVIRKAVYPSVLVECGFLSNRADAGQIATSSYRETLAEKISEAVVEERYGGSDNRVARSGSADANGGAIPH
ncbi:MAG: N-acetylmuramoyl-L-alanine amidase [Chthoniobacterales bacterium]